jgi:SAM-dependent methyltransferase
MPGYLIEIRHVQTEDAEQQAYDTIHGTRSLTQNDSLYLWFLEHVARYGPGRLLDVSCGEGTFLRFARRAGFEAVGIDFSQIALRHACQSDPSSRLALADAQRLPFADETFDVVTNIGSLEHYFDPGEAAREMARVLRAEGTAVVWLPNAYGLFGNITHVMRYGEIYDDGQPLQRYASRASWEQLLGENGLIAECVVGYERAFARTLPDLVWQLRRPWKIARLLIAPLLPVNLSNQLIFICRRSPRWRHTGM